jgi:hypothetical protein
MFSRRKLFLPLDKTSGGGVLTPQLILWRRGFNPSVNPLEEGFQPLKTTEIAPYLAQIDMVTDRK